MASLDERMALLEELIDLLRPPEEDYWDAWEYQDYDYEPWDYDDFSDPYEYSDPCPVCSHKDCYGDCVTIETRPKARRK